MDISNNTDLNWYREVVVVDIGSTTNRNVFHAFGRRVLLTAGARFRQVAGPAAADTQAPAKAGESVRVEWAVRGDNGWWWVTDAGHRVLQRDTECRATVTVG